MAQGRHKALLLKIVSPSGSFEMSQELHMSISVTWVDLDLTLF
jgi:hypothetical protein